MPGENEENRKCSLNLFGRERTADGLIIATKCAIAVPCRDALFSERALTN